MQQEFEEARTELQQELNKGITIEELKKKIMKGDIKTKVSRQLENKNYFSVERVQRKKRDIAQYLTKYPFDNVEEKPPASPERATSVLNFFSEAIEAKHNSAILNKKTFKLGNEEIMVGNEKMMLCEIIITKYFHLELNLFLSFCLKVIVTNTSGKINVHLATTYKALLILHWGVAQKAGEWVVIYITF
jgi:alpha-glucan, water dikinase